MLWPSAEYSWYIHIVWWLNSYMCIDEFETLCVARYIYSCFRIRTFTSHTTDKDPRLGRNFWLIIWQVTSVLILWLYSEFPDPKACIDDSLASNQMIYNDHYCCFGHMMWPWHSHMCSTLKHEPLQNQGQIKILQCWRLGWCTVWDSVWLWTYIHWWDKKGIGYQIEGTSGHQERRDWEVSLCQACLVSTPPTPLGEYKNPGSSGQQHHPADEAVPCTSPSKTQGR